MLFDTDVLIWALRGNTKAAMVIDKCPELQISAVSYMELLKGARNKEELLSIRKFLADLGFQILPLDENISHRAMIYIEEHALKSGMDIADALIAATASERSLTICTGNNRHYSVIPGLQLSVFRP
ncbi:MAG TPA: VapC toxin family PIN domain ribonuclease [Lentisphaeria bacterium]|nr:MAG: twitching motility protein PilT [Lentisphaerae bacterium GWF2_49_21]HBC86134.1 VapC toxin family PIN domain ribonuclease [Lentisphaeria bacterium]